MTEAKVDDLVSKRFICARIIFACIYASTIGVYGGARYPYGQRVINAINKQTDVSHVASRARTFQFSLDTRRVLLAYNVTFVACSARQ